MNYELKFHEYLQVFADNSRTTLTQPMIGLYDKALMRFGYEKVCEAMEAIAMDTKVWQMPTPQSIVAKIENKPSRIAEANEVAGRIIRAMDKFGYMSPVESEQFIGSVGWEVVKRFGGWSLLCEQMGSTMNITSGRAQLRDMALSIMEISSHRSIEEAPQLENSVNKKLESAVKLISERKKIP